MILPPAATAASGADPSNPSLNQYVESVPSSHGDRTPPSGGAKSPDGQLPASVQRQIETQGGRDAKQLESIATSPALGAPASSTDGAGGGRETKAEAADHSPSSLDALTSAATGGDGNSLGLLVLGLVLVTALLGGSALARRRFTAS